MEHINQALRAGIAGVSQAATITLGSDSWRPSIDEHEATLTKAADACSTLMACMEARLVPRWLTLTGEAGCGKTLLARQIYLRSLAINPGNASNYCKCHENKHNPVGQLW